LQSEALNPFIERRAYEQQEQFSFWHGGKSAAPGFLTAPPANRDAGHAVPPFSSGEQTNKVLQPVATASRQAWPGNFDLFGSGLFIRQHHPSMGRPMH